MTRRSFTQLGATVAAAPVLLAQSPGLTTISYNILACLGFPSSASNRWRLEAAREQMKSRMAQELQLYRPDIVSFSESVVAADAAAIANLLGMRHAFFAPGVASYAGYPIGFPGTLFTRHRIVETENAPYAGATPDASLFTRHWGRAVINTGRDRIAFFSGHLHPSNAQIRGREIDVMLRVMGREIDAGASILFQGDLNHTPGSPEYKRWIDAGFTDTFGAKGAGDGFTFSSVEPKTRIDYIWAHGPLAKRIREARVLHEGAFRVNREDPASFALSDHLPVMTSFD